MKKTIVLAVLAASAVAGFSRQPKVHIDPPYKLVIPSDSLSELMANRNFSTTQAKFSHILMNGDELYLLPQGGMPCIVPDMSYYNYNMPVIRGNITGFMPNASPHLQLIPKAKPGNSQ